MAQAASQIGADAVVAVVFTSSYSPGAVPSVVICRVEVAGTAVRLPWPDGTLTPEVYAKEK